MSDQAAGDDAAVRAVVEAVALAPAFQAAEVACAGLAQALSASAVTVWHVDYVMRELHVVGRWPGTGGDETDFTDTAAVVASLVGVVFRQQQLLVDLGIDGSATLLVPLTSRGHRIGVVELLRSAEWPSELQARAVLCAVVLAPLLWEAGRGDDLQERRRRSARLSLTAEMQWQLLQTRGLVVPEEFTIFAQLEPADLVSSDLYDWSHDGHQLAVTVVDAVGEGVVAAQASELALTALRNARRAPVALAEAVSLADQALWDEFRGKAEVAALVMEHNVHTGETTAIRAGNPPPMIWRGGRLHTVYMPSDAPLGVEELSTYRRHALTLLPGDLVLLVTDGVLTARNAAGTPFGTAGLSSVLNSADVPDWEIPRVIVHAVREHVGAMLPDDATCLAVRLAEHR